MEYDNGADAGDMKSFIDGEQKKAGTSQSNVVNLAAEPSQPAVAPVMPNLVSDISQPQ